MTPRPNLPGKMPYWEGQSFGVIPPGTNPKNGKPNSVRLYSIAASRYGDDFTGETTTLCVRRATYWCPELGAEDPAKKVRVGMGHGAWSMATGAGADVGAGTGTGAGAGAGAGMAALPPCVMRLGTPGPRFPITPLPSHPFPYRVSAPTTCVMRPLVLSVR